MRIQLTFTEEEKWMYDYIMNKSSRAGWIKDKLAPEIIKEKAIAGTMHTIPEEILQKYI